MNFCCKNVFISKFAKIINKVRTDLLSRRIFTKMSDREFVNEFDDYSTVNTVLDPNSLQIKQQMIENILLNIKKLVQFLEKNISRGIDFGDTSIYTGVSGIALMYIHLHQVLSKTSFDANFLSKSQSLIDKILPSLKARKYSFICGDSGPISIAAYLHFINNNVNESNKHLNTLKSMSKNVIQLNTDLPDEVLYGRAGFLYSLLFVRKYIPFSSTTITDDMIRNVVDSIIRSGRRTAQHDRQRVPPLMFYWHEKAYIGAAHGLIGIMMMLLQAKQYLSSEELNNLVKPTIDFILSLRLPSGNYPSSLGNSSDRLVHWCHGAPGASLLFSLAHQVFADERYLNAAKECAELIWRRGILKKGYGICHGTAGNAYAFLSLYQVTNNEKYLYRAAKFAEWCFDYGEHGCRTPDRPFSLFEGLAGTIYFLADLIEPKNSSFPAFRLL